MKQAIALTTLALALLAAGGAEARTLLDFLTGRPGQGDQLLGREPRRGSGGEPRRELRREPRREPRPQVDVGPQNDPGYFPDAPPRAEEELRVHGTWVLKKTSWDEFDEMAFSEFVRAIGRSGCRTVDSCIRSPANPYRDTDPSSAEYKFWSDCADFPYFLRSYFAYHNGLPMAYSTGMAPLPLTPEQEAQIASGEKTAQNDLRYSWNGNRASGKVLLPNQKTGMTDFFANHTRMQNQVATATYRVDPRRDDGDMYTPKITLGSIRPGTAVYDPNGHVGVVYDVTDDGQVMVFDALVDTQSVSPRRPYSSDFYKRSRPQHGAWLANFRPIEVVGATFHPELGGYMGGRVRMVPNAEIPDFSLEMFGNTQTADGKSAYLLPDGKVTTSFQEFLRRRMFIGKYQLDAVAEFKLRLKTICEDFESRVGLVQNATAKGVATMPHAAKLPDTIYGGEGEWDVYSTPGGDVRRRNSVEMAVAAAKELKALVDKKNPDYAYRGQDLKSDMLKAAAESLNACHVTYVNSVNQKVTLNLDQLLKRMPRMSFSPYHCIELRWGADTKEELASCPDVNDPTKVRWWRAQQTLRNLMTRDTNLFTGYTLDQLEAKAAELGPATHPNYDLIERLNQEL